jgi:hypothetical protein
MIQDEALLKLAQLGGELMLDLASKHENGSFLSEIVNKNPHYHKSVIEILENYCELIKELGTIFNSYDEELINQWIKKLSTCRSKEIKLVFDSSSIELGVNH